MEGRVTSEQASPRGRVFALRSGRVPIFTPLIFGFIAGLSAIDIARATGQLNELALDLVGLFVAFASISLATSLLRRGIPDGLRLTDTALELLRGRRIVRRVDLTRLKEVSEFESQAGKVLLVADRHRHITLPSFALADAHHYDDLTHQIVEAMARIDPSGRVARGAVSAGRLRESIARQPVRGALILAGLVSVASIFAFRNLENLSSTPFPLEAAGALSGPLVLRGETFRILSYLFLHASFMHLAVCAVGILYIGMYLEKLLGWERVLIGFVAGAVGGAIGHVLLAPPVAAIGAGGALFGLFGLLGAVALVKRRMPPTLMPHPGFWVLTLVLALLLPTTALELVPATVITWPPTIGTLGVLFLDFLKVTAVDVGGALFGLVTGMLMVTGVDIPAAGATRLRMRPFAYLAAAALGIGLVGAVTLPVRDHTGDNGIVAQALLDLPKSEEVALLQRGLAHPRLMDAKSSKETIALAARLAAMAVDNTDRSNPVMLDTLAVARYRQGQVGEARSLETEAIRLVMEEKPTDSKLLKDLRQHEEDIENNAPLRPDPPRDLLP
jgi:membrane associated rhomboid family serine protease